jgi:predicted flap endonuclease-1-like 5' DNA nuclease
MIKLFLALNVFGENLLKNYNREDATFEILIMLLGAFALGFLLRHLIGFRKKEYIIEQNLNASTNDATSDLADQIERLRLEVNRLIGKSDDVFNESVLKSTSKGSNKQKPKQETTTLGEISALASLKSAEVKTLGDLVSYKTENDKSENPSVKKKGDTADDLKLIEGIGPALEKLLNENQIFSFDQLANKNVAELEEILEKAGPRFRVHVPETWPEQAALLRDGKTEAFKALTERLKGGRRV